MKTRKNCRMAGLMIGWLLAMPVIPRAEAGFLVEDFESYVLPTNVVDIGHGWGASSNTVVVESVLSTNLVDSTKAASVTPGQFMTNQVSMSESRIWTEAWLNGTNFITPDSTPPADTAAVFMVGLSTNGYLYVCNPTTLVWEACSTDANNGSALVVPTGTWARVSVFQNYANHKVAIFVNDQLIRKELPFINTNSSSYTTLRFDGAGGGNVHVDNVIVSNSTPQGLVSDSDNDGRPDAEELTLFGTLTNWAGSIITASVTNSVGGTVSPSDTGLLRWGGQTNFVLTATTAYLVDRVWTNGVLAYDYSNSLLKTASYTWTGIRSDGTLTAGFFYEGTRYVPADHATLTLAIAAAREGDRIVVASGTYNESATVSGNRILVVSNSVVDFGTLALQNGAVIQGHNSTATVNGVTFTGNFTLHDNWEAAIVAHPFNLEETFENYDVGIRLDHLGFYGWNASDAGVTVVANPDVAGNATAKVAGAPSGVTISNLMDGAGAGFTNIWTDVMIRGGRVEQPDLIDTNGASPVMFLINTNGYLTVLTTNGWDVCDKDVWSNNAPTVGIDEWAEISWFMDFGRTTAAYFVKGHLVRQAVAFAKPATKYHGMQLDTSLASAWLDSVNILTNVPAGLLTGAASDLDNDTMADALEIQLYGNTRAFYLIRGSVFKIR